MLAYQENSAATINNLNPTIAPLATHERITTLDSLRGVAVLGILLLNIISFGLPKAYVDPSVYGGIDGWNLVAFVTNNLFFEGTMRGLFSLLFGASILLLSERAEARGDTSEFADMYYRRMLWLFLFGVIHAWALLWFGDVLYWYALAGMFLFPLRKLSPRTLIILGLLALATLIPRTAIKIDETTDARTAAQAAQRLVAQQRELTDEQAQAIAHWQSIESWAKPNSHFLEQRIQSMQGDYLSVLREITPIIIAYESTILYKGGFFDAIGCMLLGMALLKLGVLTGKRSVRFYLWMMLVGFGLGVAVNIFETWKIITNDFDIITLMTWGFLGVTYDLGRIPVTLGFVGLIALIGKLGWYRLVMKKLANVGRMALTNYVMQSVICAFVFYGFGLGLFGQLERYQLYYVVGIIWVLQIVGSSLWLKYFHFGPLEWLWRSLTYWRLQNFLRQYT